MNKSQSFVIWLDGFLSATDNNPTTEQVKKIREKLDDVFEHVVDTPTIQTQFFPFVGNTEDRIVKC